MTAFPQVPLRNRKRERKKVLSRCKEKVKKEKGGGRIENKHLLRREIAFVPDRAFSVSLQDGDEKSMTRKGEEERKRREPLRHKQT